MQTMRAMQAKPPPGLHHTLQQSDWQYHVACDLSLAYTESL